jgi:nucleotide-binding universal stress UspA family protein
VRDDKRPAVGRIVVGVDSSNAASAALDWAIDEANRNGAELVVMHAWHRPAPADRSVRLGDLRRADAEGVVDVAVRYCQERTTRTVRGEAPVGDPATVLLTASEGADLVVVGSRGRSGFRTALFGSVALDLADDARCPVVVIHPRLRRPPAA